MKLFAALFLFTSAALGLVAPRPAQRAVYSRTHAPALLIGASPARPTLAASRSLVLLQEPDGVAEAKLTWNTAIDAEGNTYYWNSAGASTYEQPADFDPATAKSSGVYQAKGNDGALYDDEVPEGQQVVYTSGEKKPTLSNTMRDKMIAESRGLGADPNAKNPFLPVFFGVGVFVVLGALTQI